jgi:hypothetical protein
MSGTAGPALEQALACHRAPALLAAAQSRPLPEGMLTLLRLAAGDQAMAAQCALASDESETEVAEAAAFFIQQVLFAPGADSYRMLGVNPDAPDAQLKEHYRWLVRWLHPDRNTDDWDSVYADRVNVAWQTLRLPERRRSYDEARHAGRLLQAAAPAPQRERAMRSLPGRHDAPEPALMSPDTVARLPLIVLGGLGGVAITLLFLMWLGADRPGQRARPAPVAVVEPPAALLPAGPALIDEPAPAVLAAVQAPPAPVAPAMEAGPADALREMSTPAAVPNPPDPVPPAREVAPAPDVMPAPEVAPAAATAPAQAAAPAALTNNSPALQEAEAMALLGRFSQAYEAGDIRTLMQLFTRDARNNRGGREAIAYDYQSLFSTTDTRELRLSPAGWIARDDGGTVLARYEAVVRLDGRRRADVTRGDIRFDLRLENGSTKISLVTHD